VWIKKRNPIPDCKKTLGAKKGKVTRIVGATSGNHARYRGRPRSAKSTRPSEISGKRVRGCSKRAKKELGTTDKGNTLGVEPIQHKKNDSRREKRKAGAKCGVVARVEGDVNLWNDKKLGVGITKPTPKGGKIGKGHNTQDGRKGNRREWKVKRRKETEERPKKGGRRGCRKKGKPRKWKGSCR